MTAMIETSLNPRQEELLRLVAEQGFTTIEALAQRFGVSSQTARRDVAHLDALGFLKRFHGGAGPLHDGHRLPYAQKQEVARGAKACIGQAAAALIPPGGSLFLDVGTTAEATARALAGRSDVFVVTASVKVAGILAQGGVGDVVVTGGLLRGPDGSLVGEEVKAAIARYRLDYAVIGCSGFDEDGSPMDFDVLKIDVNRAMIARARQSVLVADATKFDRMAPVQVAQPAQFGRFITDRAPPMNLRRSFEENGSVIHYAIGGSSSRDLEQC
jgi:DeoR family glycerol-3-phosphate regulon repressor